jgi:phenylacetyl-CoA:acceptor oxidoreductase subunit 1
LCIGCAYCAVACPYQARYKTNRASFAYGAPTESESQRHDSSSLGVATKCTFCVDRIDAGLAKGQQPGIDPEATPACVNACIAEALAFGDVDDPQSNVSALLAENQHFRMHEELGTGPGFFYLWDKETR